MQPETAIATMHAFGEMFLLDGAPIGILKAYIEQQKTPQ